MKPCIVRNVRPRMRLFSRSFEPLAARTLGALGLLVLLTAALRAQSVCAADAAPANQWSKAGEDAAAARPGSVLLYDAEGDRMLLVGPTDAGASVQAFDPAKNTWSNLDVAGPAVKGGLHPYYQAAYDPAGKTVYCLSGDAVLYSWRLGDKAWKTHPAAPELEGLSWHTMACDPAGRKLVVVGADKRADDLGWSRTVVFDIAAGRWSRLETADDAVRQQHRGLVAAREAAIDLAGHIRLAWFRDPKGAGTAEELQALQKRCEALKKLPTTTAFDATIDSVAAQLAAGETLDALAAARALVCLIEEAAEAQFPAPCSRRNSPLAFDGKNGVFVLFGGDHEDYLMNDTWVLDLRTKTWRRSKVGRAPSPRAGHALCGLPKRGGVVLYEGYVQSSNTDYGAVPYAPLDPRQLWHYDPAADRWNLLAAWPLPDKDDRSTPPPLGFFDGYANQWFCPPALAATADDTLVLAAHVCELWHWRWKRPSETWTLGVDPARSDAAGAERLGTAANQRLHRTGAFRAAFCEVPEKPKDTGLDRLPANRWVRLPEPPRNPCRGCRQRDWGTCVWDSDREQVLHWGGGHCVRSASTVAHYSPAAGRIVEGFDADEPYGANGGGGFDSSLWNRPWVSTHNYNHYAYDPKCKLLVSGRGYLYDPGRMDWLRIEPLPVPFVFSWGETCVETSPHGAVAWARRKGAEQAGMWLFDRDRGWTDLKPKGPLFVPYCDAHGMVYDSKRDRMILGGVGGGYEKTSDGTFLAFDFKTGTVEPLAPANPSPARTRNAREMVYLDHADCVLIGELYPHRREGEKKGPRYTRIYDCAKNRMHLLDAGEVPDGHSTGWMYDARRKLVYVFTYRGEAWALNFVPETAKLVERAAQ